jgi:tetratricopeptide (TPR) repeat protein
MKTLNIIPILILILVLMLTKLGLANDSKYVEAMQKNIQSIYDAQTIEQFQASVNTFERIGAAEKSKWEPQYYAAYGYIMMANKEKDGGRKDAYLDQAMPAIEKAKALAPNESELIALEGFAYMIRVTVDPAARGSQYAGLAMQTYQKALTINPENPRALALLAQMQYGTAQFFGSSTIEACGTLKSALDKFETYKAPNSLAPQWGKRMAEGLKENCK